MNGQVLLAQEFRHATGWIRHQGLGAVIKDSTEHAAGRNGLGNTHWSLAADLPDMTNVMRFSIEMARACRLPSFNAYH